MTGERRAEPEIEAFFWDYSPGSNVEHIAKHDVVPIDVQEVRDNEPHFFAARPGYLGYVMLGPNREGRYLYVAMVETPTAGVWQVIIAYWLSLRRAERLYFKE